MLNAFETEINYIFLKYNNHELTYEETMNYLNRYLFLLNVSRFDLKNMGNKDNSLKIIKHDKELNFWFPNWFMDENGKGCQLEYSTKKVNLIIQFKNSGDLKFYFRGVDFRNLENQNIPIYVNYDSITVNKVKINHVSQLVWHNEPFNYSIICENEEIINLEVESKTMFDYFPQLKNFFKDINDSSELNKEFLNILQFITYEKIIIEQGDSQKMFYQLDDYKSNFYSNMDIKLLANHLNNEIYNLKSEFEQYKENTDRIINAHYELFNTLFLYHNFETKGLLKYNHILNLELLDFVVNICKKYGLEYWLDFGLLLGAIRHEGFVPWDDDLDIGMIREDYDVFLDKIKEEIDNNGLSDLLKISINVHFFKPLPILQLLYYCEEVHDTIIAGIDIFPYDFIDDISSCDLKTYLNVRNSVINNNRNGMPINEALKEYFNKFNLSYGTKKYTVSGIEGGRGSFKGFEKIIFETKDIFPLKKAKFENTDYYIPNNPHKFLAETYGDYLNIPKVPYHHQERYDHLRKRDDGLEIFKKHIIKMKEINESYKY